MIYIHICGFDHPDKYTNHETEHLRQQSWQTVMLTYLLKPDSHASATRPRRASPHIPALTLLRAPDPKQLVRHRHLLLPSHYHRVKRKTSVRQSILYPTTIHCLHPSTTHYLHPSTAHLYPSTIRVHRSATRHGNSSRIHLPHPNTRKRWKNSERWQKELSRQR